MVSDPRLALSAVCIETDAGSDLDATGAGFSPSRLRRVDAIIKQHIDERRVPGAIVLVARRDRVAYRCALGGVGAHAAASAALRPDTIFWLASMTKPIVAAAVLMLMEEGKIQLGDAVAKFIPEFAAPRNVRVFARAAQRPALGSGIADEPPHTLVPAGAEITVQQLLSHTSGLQSVGVPNRAIPVIGETDTVAHWVPKLAHVPLDYQPGTRWSYSNAIAYEVLVRIVEIAAQERIDAFLRRRLFGPLGMTDTGFGMQHRHPDRVIPLPKRLAENPCVAGTTYFSGSAGLWATAADYARFAQMLANAGSVNGARILQPDTVRLMTSDQTRGLFSGWRDIDGAGAQLGLGVLVIIDPARAKVPLPSGSFGWDGVGSRRFWVIPKEEMVLVMLMPGGNAEPVHRAIEHAVLDAIAN